MIYKWLILVTHVEVEAHDDRKLSAEKKYAKLAFALLYLPAPSISSFKSLLFDNLWYHNLAILDARWQRNIIKIECLGCDQLWKLIRKKYK